MAGDSPSASMIAVIAKRIRESALEQFPPESELDAWARECRDPAGIKGWCDGTVEGVRIDEVTRNGEPVIGDILAALHDQTADETIILQAHVNGIRMWIMFWAGVGHSSEFEFECVYKDRLPFVPWNEAGALERRVNDWIRAVIVVAASTRARCVEVPGISEEATLVLWADSGD